jgi:hypothetical protein
MAEIIEDTQEKKTYPLASHLLKPIARFPVGDRYLSLYWNTARVRDVPYSLYYDGESNPVQHNMCDIEAFEQIERELEKAKEGEGS